MLAHITFQNGDIVPFDLYSNSKALPGYVIYAFTNDPDAKRYVVTDKKWAEMTKGIDHKAIAAATLTL